MFVATTALLSSCAQWDTAGETVDPLQTAGPPVYLLDQADKPIPVVSGKAAKTNTSLPWRFLSASADGRSIRLMYSAGDASCVSFVGFTVKETSSTVTLTDHGSTDHSQQACGGGDDSRAGVLTLQQPLGTRQLMHAPVDHNWESWGK